MYRLKKNSWRPARFRPVDYYILTGTFALGALIRGFDYAAGERVWGISDAMSPYLPHKMWGVMFLIGATLLVIGLLGRRHAFIFLGHNFLAAVYGLNALSLLLVVVTVSRFNSDGIRWVGTVMLIGLVHALLALRTGKHPIPMGAEPADGDCLITGRTDVQEDHQ